RAPRTGTTAAWRRGSDLFLTSSRLGGAVGLRSNPGEGVQDYQLSLVPADRRALTPTLQERASLVSTPQERGEEAHQRNSAMTLISPTMASLKAVISSAGIQYSKWAEPPAFWTL